jgi:hypothetical protein
MGPAPKRQWARVTRSQCRWPLSGTARLCGQKLRSGVHVSIPFRRREAADLHLGCGMSRTRSLPALAVVLLAAGACLLGEVGVLATDGVADEVRDAGGLSGSDARPPALDAATADAGSTAADASIADASSSADAGARADGGSADAAADSGVAADAGTPADAGLSADAGLPKFSFFATSFKALQALSGNPEGFGGDLRYGETGPGAGLSGADKICAAIAERSMAGSSAKQWRAFLSVAADANGNQVDAIDRVGEGPWYDRLGRLFANKKSELLNDRPLSANATIKNDFPNEDGVPNHNPDLTGEVDNHHFLTGSTPQGRLLGSGATCKDWTTSDGSAANGKPRVGLSWPRTGGGGGGSWISALDEAGCAADANLVQTGPAPPGTNGVGSGGGYGGIYCFALVP